MTLKYLAHYPDSLQSKVKALIERGELATHLTSRYPEPHTIKTDKALYSYVDDLRSTHLRNSQPLQKVCFDGRIHAVNDALGMHTRISRVQGGKLKAKREIRIASVFRAVPKPFLRMITVHELAHLKEREHNKAFYDLCDHMAPGYHQLEFDLRLYLTQVEMFGKLY